MVLLYTGLTRPLFDWLLKYGPKKVICSKLKVEDHLLIALIKLRRGLSNQDIAYRFGVASGTISKLLRSWIVALTEFSANNLIYWPEKRHFVRTYPKFLRRSFLNVWQ